MDLYAITESGRQALSRFRKTDNYKKSEILGYIDLAGRVNITQLAYALHLTENEVESELKSFLDNRWVRLDKSKTMLF